MLQGLFSSCSEQGLLPSCGAQSTLEGGFSSCGAWVIERRLSSCGIWTKLLHGIWDLPRPGIETVSPALAG